MAGWRWLLAGFAIFRRNPPLLGMLVIAYWFTLLFLNIIPFLGSLAASLAMPGLSVGLMQAARNLERAEPISLATLYGSLKENSRTLIGLGALYLVLTLAALGIAALFDGGATLSALLSSKPEEKATLDLSDVLLSMLVTMSLMTPVLMAYWFAPVLAAWHQLSVGKSLFFSFVACWLNWRAFLAYSAALLLLAGIVPGIMLGVLLLLFPAIQGMATGLVTMLMVLVVAPIVFASFYASYRDIFGISEIV
jgi:hypothetical protein